MNPIDAITQLRAKHNSGEKSAGVDIVKGEIGDMEKLEVIEPIKVKEQVMKSATETANMILRIDNIVAVSRSSSPEPSQGTPPGAGGMGMY